VTAMTARAMLLFPTVSHDSARAGSMQCRERLDGLRQFYACKAA
jgi:hypothetical protein